VIIHGGFLIMHYVYIIYSKKADKFYVGETEDLEKRLLQHNNGFFKGSYTTRANDWELKCSLTFRSLSHARKAEAFIKRMNSRKFIENLILENSWLLEKFS
jgi:putative endonuclease